MASSTTSNIVAPQNTYTVCIICDESKAHEKRQFYRQLMEELNFKCGNPGAVQFGNFINYYQFHPADNRIAILPQNIWNFSLQKPNKCYVLDVGCNTGDLTTALHHFLKDIHNSLEYRILGVDIDPTLIKRACENCNLNNIEFKCCDIMTPPQNDPVQEFLMTENINAFDVVFCFSITMWIHLNHGDDGLKLFLEKVSKLTNFLVIEPQPWKCYRSAVKRLKLGKSEFLKFKELKIRQNVEEEIESFITNQCGLLKIRESKRTQWGRKLLFFKRKIL